MFERFTTEAREVVVDAQDEARRLRHGWIGCEHFLLALTRRPSAVADALASHGVTTAVVHTTVTELVRVPVNDAEALASIGIDLDQVRAHVEATFGPGALERATVTKRRWRRVRRHSKQCGSQFGPAFTPSTAQIPFTPRAKRCLEMAATIAEPNLVRPRHLGVSLMSRSDTMAGTVLARLGVDLGALGGELAELPDGLA